MNIELIERKQEQVLALAVDRYAVSPQVIQEVTDFAEQQGHYIIAFLQDQEAFVLSDGEPYTQEAVRKSRTKN